MSTTTTLYLICAILLLIPVCVFAYFLFLRSKRTPKEEKEKGEPKKKEKKDEKSSGSGFWEKVKAPLIWIVAILVVVALAAAVWNGGGGKAVKSFGHTAFSAPRCSSVSTMGPECSKPRAVVAKAATVLCNPIGQPMDLPNPPAMLKIHVQEHCTLTIDLSPKQGGYRYAGCTTLNGEFVPYTETNCINGLDLYVEKVDAGPGLSKGAPTATPRFWFEPKQHLMSGFNS